MVHGLGLHVPKIVVAEQRSKPGHVINVLLTTEAPVQVPLLKLKMPIRHVILRHAQKPVVDYIHIFLQMVIIVIVTLIIVVVETPPETVLNGILTVEHILVKTAAVIADGVSIMGDKL